VINNNTPAARRRLLNVRAARARTFRLRALMMKPSLSPFIPEAEGVPRLTADTPAKTSL
jgi:hypothetical protein